MNYEYNLFLSILLLINILFNDTNNDYKLFYL